MPRLDALGFKLPSQLKLPGRWSGVPSGQNAGWLKRSPPPVTDVTARFKALLGAAKAGKPQLPGEAKDHVYLLVGGLFTNQYPGYMDGNLKSLKQAGLEARRVGIDTSASVETNAKAIRDAVLEASKGGKKVVLVGQSKGGVDATAALSLYPELKGRVRAVVAMQAPYGGTPIASDLRNCPELKPLLKQVIGSVMKGDVKSLLDLSYEARRDFVSAHPYPSDVPTVSLATSRDSLKSIVDVTARYMRERYGIASDGLVPQADAEIPGSRVVRLSDMDHAESVLKGVPGFPNYQPEPLTLALIGLALEK